ncbi:GNAT family N-acetyltransferase [Periweissella cryptocerci]|uniref:GNAT family N-acetyltransferase n=1 Tax=Periweissella cryptocerci TaxID=2506420 RepID=A0A4P6YU31_9LACO|nr:GNAT family N-acetyltransferase [Periweissella cryptocerci]QBO36211.1 GNAT family N-acetyltransferase [Periweissella cryptocerci]
MEYVQTAVMSAQQLADVRELITEIQVFDGTADTPYLFNNYNVDKALPAFFLAYDGDIAVGFLSIYADSVDEAGIAVLVKPAYRRRGIFTELQRQAELVLVLNNYTEITYQSERKFIDENPTLLPKLGFAVDEDNSEYLLEFDMTRAPLLTNPAVTVELANAADVERLATITMHAFGSEESDYESSMAYAQENVVSTTVRYYKIMAQNTIVGTVAVDVDPTMNYIFGLAIDPAYQGHGYGTQAVALIAKEINALNDLPLKLSVEAENEVAKHVYEKSGFVTLAEVVYLDYVAPKE